MCGIVAAVTQRNIINFLLESIQKLEYRGYDSSGLALINKNNNFFFVKNSYILHISYKNTINY